MRSSKKRSRSNQNRPRTLGNIINRVFDSSGPEGKVRGTPQQIIEKYQMLARDAQLSNDRVAAENFLQHAEHYTRMLAEATREMAAEQEARQQQYQQNGGQQGQGGQNGGQNGGQQGQPRGDRPEGQERRDRDNRDSRDNRNDRQERGERRQDFNRDYREERSFPAEEQPMASDVIELDAGDDTGLIETPESAPRARPEPEPAVATEEAAPKEERAPRRPRGPRKPKGEGKPDGEPPKKSAE
ncbi:DUF4167 domain-containing protein [Tabrizicola sp.]|uniref:DUF4167 domain-containing protein n=1 Tax=Tabrizicola sp. TaxID=2005166 RepID=UPI001A4CC4D1|nr:DUF4167 domain-containing protein [Tabrizicola sp.]MBL9074562.1 DUF4167 domain-containing protein [Tabrizicola sp.]